MIADIEASKPNLHYSLTSRVPWITGYNDSQTLRFDIFLGLLNIELVLLLEVARTNQNNGRL